MRVGRKGIVRIFSHKSNGEYEYNDYKCTYLLEEKKGEERGGLRRQCEGSVRIMTKNQIHAAVGDYMAFNVERTAPEPRIDFAICSVRDNRQGVLPHWRIITNSYDY